MRSDKTDLSQQFAKFAGRAVKAQDITHHVRVGDATYPVTHVEIDQNDPAVAELRAAVQAAGLSLRLWTPGSMGTMDYRLDRLNAGIEKAADGTYRIGHRFHQQPPVKGDHGGHHQILNLQGVGQQRLSVDLNIGVQRFRCRRKVRIVK